MKIDILLPFKEKFSMNFASAVSITVLNAFQCSRFKKNIHTHPQNTPNPNIFFRESSGLKMLKQQRILT